MRNLDLAGLKFTRLTVIRIWSMEKGTRQWFCRCDCGNMKTVRAGNLRTGNTKSCGCLRWEMLHNGINKGRKLPSRVLAGRSAGLIESIRGKDP